MPTNWKERTCGTCEYRNYGNDSHYICCRPGYSMLKVRTNKNKPACAEYKEKEK